MGETQNHWFGTPPGSGAQNRSYPQETVKLLMDFLYLENQHRQTEPFHPELNKLLHG